MAGSLQCNLCYSSNSKSKSQSEIHRPDPDLKCPKWSNDIACCGPYSLNFLQEHYCYKLRACFEITCLESCDVFFCNYLSYSKILLRSYLKIVWHRPYTLLKILHFWNHSEKIC